MDRGNDPVPAVAGEPGWRYDRPPVGKKVLLLTEGGVAVIGLWSKDGGFVAWSPLPKVKKH